MGTQKSPTINRGLTRPPVNVFNFRWLSYRYDERKITRANFARSLGWATIGPSSSHRREPFTSLPTCGIMTRTSSRTETAAIGSAKRLRSPRSTNAAAVPTQKAIASHSACFETIR